MSDASQFPGILAEIAEVVGTEATWAIIRQCGGTRVTFPAHPDPDHWLSRLIGYEAALTLGRHFAVGSPDGRETGLHGVVLPVGPNSIQRVAQRRLAAEIKAGKSVRAAAREVGVHERTAWRVNAKLKNDDQGELF